MAYSNINKDIKYKEYNKIEKKDINYEAALYEMELYNTKITILYIITSALAGTIGEIFLMKFAKNTWHYQKPNFFGTPSWLPPLWAIACIGALEIFVITNNINYLVNKK